MHRGPPEAIQTLALSPRNPRRLRPDSLTTAREDHFLLLLLCLTVHLSFSRIPSNTWPGNRNQLRHRFKFCSGESFSSRCHAKFSLCRLSHPSSLSSPGNSRHFPTSPFLMPTFFFTDCAPKHGKAELSATPVPVPLLSTTQSRRGP